MNNKNNDWKLVYDSDPHIFVMYLFCGGTIVVHTQVTVLVDRRCDFRVRSFVVTLVAIQIRTVDLLHVDRTAPSVDSGSAERQGAVGEQLPGGARLTETVLFVAAAVSTS